MADLSVQHIDALGAIIKRLIASDPLDESSWDVDFKPCVPIAKAHLLNWSNDAQVRADRRSRGKTMRGTLSAKNATLYVSDSALETVAIRYGRREPQAFNKSGNAVSNAWAGTFLSRTSLPFYHGEQQAYPIHCAQEKKVTSKCKDVWVYLRGSSGSANLSFGQMFKDHARYFSPKMRARLLATSGLVSEEEAVQIMKKVYPFTVRSVLGIGANPRMHRHLGSSLHEAPGQNDRLYICGMACRGTFDAIFTWNRFNNVLVQGGWPWLLRYSRAYAKVIYTALALLFAVVEVDSAGYHGSACDDLLALAGKLVGVPEGEDPWRVRKGSYLKGPGVAVPVMGAALTGDKKVHVQASIEGKPEAASAAAEGPAATWTYAEPAVVPWEGVLPTHVAEARACSHAPGSATSARVKLATSISELEALTESNDSLVVSTTVDEKARNEVVSFVAKHRILTVSRSQDQCMGCAIKMAHCIGAMVVIA